MVMVLCKFRFVNLEINSLNTSKHGFSSDASMVSAAARKALREAPSKLSQVVQHLEQKPHLRLFGVTSLAVRYDAKRVSPGTRSVSQLLSSKNYIFIFTRHFVKDALPRLRWANPELAIDVEKVFKAEESVKQSIMLTYGRGLSNHC